MRRAIRYTSVGMETLPHLLIGYAARRASVRPTRRPGAPTLIELQDTFWNAGRPASLRRWRESLPDALVLSCRASRLITHELDSGVYSKPSAEERARLVDAGGLRATPVVEQALRQTEATCAALGARAIVFDTPPRFSPTTEHRRRMSDFFSRIERVPGRLYVWEPHGVWSRGEVESVCRELALVPCLDPLADEVMQPVALETVYCRLRAPDYHELQLDQLLEWSEEQAQVVLVFAGPQGERQARRLAAAAANMSAEYDPAEAAEEDSAS